MTDRRPFLRSIFDARSGRSRTSCCRRSAPCRRGICLAAARRGAMAARQNGISRTWARSERTDRPCHHRGTAGVPTRRIGVMRPPSRADEAGLKPLTKTLRSRLKQPRTTVAGAVVRRRLANWIRPVDGVSFTEAAGEPALCVRRTDREMNIVADCPSRAPAAAPEARREIVRGDIRRAHDDRRHCSRTEGRCDPEQVFTVDDAIRPARRSAGMRSASPGCAFARAQFEMN